jgi:hypothetical protein
MSYSSSSPTPPILSFLERLPWVIAVLAAFFLSLSRTLASETCEYPNFFAPGIASSENRVGEFQIRLSPPNYSDVTAVRHHLVFSKLFAILLNDRLKADTRNQCSAVIANSLFPDLRLLLISDRSAVALGKQQDCVATLQTLLRRPLEPQDIGDFRKAAAREAQRRLRTLSNPGNGVADATNIRDQGLIKLYEPQTVMHSLVSVDWRSFESADFDAFRAWATAQQSNNHLGLSPLQFCGPDVDPQSMPPRLGRSALVPAGPVTIQRNNAGPAIARQLRHIVMVSEGPTIGFSRAEQSIAEKMFCNARQSSSDTNQPSNEEGIFVTIRCQRSVIYHEGWITFYCDPRDCINHELEEAVMRKIATAPAMMALAEKGAGGPYVVSLLGAQ